MSLRDELQGWRAAAPGFARRQRKHLTQVRYGWDHPRRVSFVFGCQRSGTKMVMWILDKSPATRIYHENHASAFRDFQLRPDPILRALVHTSPAPSQIFKPICDSQQADLILDRFPDAAGLWIYRDAADVANSSVKKWGSHQRELIEAVVAGDLDTWGWRTARLPQQTIDDLRRVYRPDLTDAEGALLFWYMRNAFFFSLGLDQHPRMRLIRYEPLVQDPEQHFPEVFHHVGAPFERRFVEAVRKSSVGRRAAPEASPEILALIDGLSERLAAWTAPTSAPPRPTPPPPAQTAGPLVSPVLVLTNTLGVGGAERYTVTISNWMVRQGCTVIVAAAPGELDADLDPAVVRVEMPLERVRAALPQIATQLQALLRTHKPAAIVANSLATAWVARAAQPTGTIPVVAVAHGWPAHRYRLVGPLMRAADRVVAVSPEVWARLVDGGLPPERCTVIYNGVDCTPLGPRAGDARRTARQTLGATEDDLLVIVVGRLSDQKAHHHAIAVADALRSRLPALRLAIVGEGENEAPLRAQVAALGLDDRVRLLGLRTDIPELLGAADVYLSTSDWEGMPLAAIEAMASALPVVSTRTEGADQLLDETCGVVVPIGDVEALSAAVEALAHDPDRRRRLGEAGRARALADFSHERMARQLMDLLVELAEAAG